MFQLTLWNINFPRRYFFFTLYQQVLFVFNPKALVSCWFSKNFHKRRRLSSLAHFRPWLTTVQPLFLRDVVLCDRRDSISSLWVSYYKWLCFVVLSNNFKSCYIESMVYSYHNPSLRILPYLQLSRFSTNGDVVQL